MEAFNIPCILPSRWAATVLDLILFFSGYSSDGKVRDLGWAALFLSAVVFFLPLCHGGGVRFAVVFNELEDDFTSDWVGITGITGGGENNHLSPLRNALGECRGVTGGVVNLSAKGSSGRSGEGSTGRTQ